MTTSNSSIDWTNFMNAENASDLQKDPEFRVWLISLLSEGMIGTTVTFLKKDGDTRSMLCTRNLALIPVESHPKGSEKKQSAAIAAFDLNKQEWRSFLPENVTRLGYQLSA